MTESLGIAVVKNEADVIEPFVRHNLGFMDALFIADNNSVDGTREILVQLQQEGLPIVLFDDPIVGHFQAEKVTAMYRQIVPEFKPRFVFLLDADEFIIAPSREVLDAQLRAVRPGTLAQYYWRTYIPAPTGPEGDVSDPLRSITHRRVREDRQPKSIIITKPDIDAKLIIGQGGHFVKLGGRSLPHVALQDAVLAHFPVRTIDQASSKALVGWITNIERNRLRPKWPKSTNGHHKKKLYERIVHGDGLTAEDLTVEALKYAQSYELTWPQDVIRDPVIPGYARLTAQPTTTCTTLQKVLLCVDNIFNPAPETPDFSAATGFLRNPNHSAKSWRDFVSPSSAVNTIQAAAAHKRRDQNLRVDLPPFRYLAEHDRPGSALQIGCGPGAYLKFFASHGTEHIRGVDSIDEKFGYLAAGEYIQADAAEPLELRETFDLVLCLDVIEHIPAVSEKVLVDNIVGHAKNSIVFSSARPGQSGSDPINSRPISHWLELFASNGWYPSLFDSLALRSLSTFPSFRGNLVVFTQDGRDAADARARLIELEKQKIKWRTQHPAVITHSFTKTASDLEKRKKGWPKLRAKAATIIGLDREIKFPELPTLTVPAKLRTRTAARRHRRSIPSSK